MMLEDVARLIDHYPQLTRTPAALLAVLMAARGRTLTHDFIYEQMEAILGYEQSSLTQAGNLKRLRIALRGTGLRIDTITGVGLRLAA